MCTDIDPQEIIHSRKVRYRLVDRPLKPGDLISQRIPCWVPKSCTEKTQVGILKIKDWFLKNKESELKGVITPSLVY